MRDGATSQGSRFAQSNLTKHQVNGTQAPIKQRTSPAYLGPAYTLFNTQFGLPRFIERCGLGKTIRQNEMVPFCMWELRIPNHITRRLFDHSHKTLRNAPDRDTDQNCKVQIRHESSKDFSEHKIS